MTERTCMWAPDAKHCLCCTQQRALEADTVSRAEHERHVSDLDECLQTEKRARIEAEAQLTALQAELATERARAEEAESDHRRVTRAFSDAAAELAAANARAGRLEDSLAKVMAAVRLTPDKLEEAMRQGESTLCAAPQASTEQADPLVAKCASCGAPATRTCDDEGQFVCGFGLCDDCEHYTNECGFGAHRRKASTEQASPSPAVGEGEGPASPPASDAERCERTVHSFKGMVRCLLAKGHEGFHSYDEPAQPAPGGTERRVNGHVFHGEDEYDFCDLCGVTWGGRFVHRCPALVAVAVDRAVNPTPAEPGGTERWVPKVGERVRNKKTGQLATVQEPSSANWADSSNVIYDDGPLIFTIGNHRLEPADPTPAEPQGRPEQAGDRRRLGGLVIEYTDGSTEAYALERKAGS